MMLRSAGPWCQAAEASLMSRVDLMLLLDLIGAASPTFRPYADPTSGECDGYGVELARIEEALLEAENIYGTEKYFRESCEGEDTIVDDHTPFLERGLRRALHVVADPFPAVWHTMEDDWEHLDTEAVARVARIIRVFVAEYLNLSITEDVKL